MSGSEHRPAPAAPRPRTNVMRSIRRLGAGAGWLPAATLAWALACAEFPLPAQADSLRISTIAGSGSGEVGPAAGAAAAVNINQPFGVEVAADGSLIICGVGHGRVYRLDAAGKQLTLVAGDGRK